MAEYVSYNKDAEVIGGALLGVVQALGEKAKPLLEKRGLTEIKPDQWYSQQAMLDIMREVSGGKKVLNMDLVSIGMRTSESIDIPDDVSSALDLMTMFQQSYVIGNRNIAENEGLVVSKEDDKRIKIVSTTPYPDDFEYGILYGLARRFMDSEDITLEQDQDAPKRRDGGDESTFYLNY